MVARIDRFGQELSAEGGESDTQGIPPQTIVQTTVSKDI